VNHKFSEMDDKNDLENFEPDVNVLMVERYIGLSEEELVYMRKVDKWMINNKLNVAEYKLKFEYDKNREGALFFCNLILVFLYVSVEMLYSNVILGFWIMFSIVIMMCIPGLWCLMQILPLSNRDTLKFTVMIISEWFLLYLIFVLITYIQHVNSTIVDSSYNETTLQNN